MFELWHQKVCQQYRTNNKLFGFRLIDCLKLDYIHERMEFKKEPIHCITNSINKRTLQTANLDNQLIMKGKILN